MLTFELQKTNIEKNNLGIREENASPELCHQLQSKAGFDFLV